jgi:hypothetical protein
VPTNVDLTNALYYCDKKGDELEVRVDEFSLTYQGSPGNDARTYFDEVRLMKRVGSINKQAIRASSPCSTCPSLST